MVNPKIKVKSLYKIYYDDGIYLAIKNEQIVELVNNYIGEFLVFSLYVAIEAKCRKQKRRLIYWTVITIVSMTPKILKNIIIRIDLFFNSNQERRVRGSRGAVAPPRKKEKRY